MSSVDLCELFELDESWNYSWVEDIWMLLGTLSCRWIGGGSLEQE